MEIKYFVRTLEGRECDLPEYVKRIFDYEHKYVKSYINALYEINDYNAVLMEDDIVLCRNFREEIEKVINKYPNNIINFFSSPDKYYTSHFSSMFIYNQCTYFPKGMTKNLADTMMSMYIPEEPGKHTIQRYGSLLNIILHNNNTPHLIYRPCLVQHIDAKSTRDGWCGRRNTPYFKDYLDEIGITMEDAFYRQNLDKLKRLLEQDREKWYKDIKKS